MAREDGCMSVQDLRPVLGLEWVSRVDGFGDHVGRGRRTSDKDAACEDAVQLSLRCRNVFDVNAPSGRSIELEWYRVAKLASTCRSKEASPAR